MVNALSVLLLEHCVKSTLELSFGGRKIIESTTVAGFSNSLATIGVADTFPKILFLQSL